MRKQFPNKLAQALELGEVARKAGRGRMMLGTTILAAYGASLATGHALEAKDFTAYCDILGLPVVLAGGSLWIWGSNIEQTAHLRAKVAMDVFVESMSSDEPPLE
ncbi:MAG: hypothetical protein WAZ18_04850 [Alphaproteobacteria bacterium]